MSMDSIVGYYGSSSPEESQENENGAGPPAAENSDEHSSRSSKSTSSSSRDKSSSPDHCSDPPYQHGNHSRSSYKERSKSRSPLRFERRSSPDRRNCYRRSRSRSQERHRRLRSPPDRRRRSRSHSQERRQRSRSRSQERHRRSRSRSPEARGHYGRRSPPRQYGGNRRPSLPHRRNRRSRSPVKRRYPSTPVVIPHRSKQPDGSTTGDSGQLDDTPSNVPGATPEQRLENALSAMQQHRAVRPGGMSTQQFQAVQEKRKQLWKKKTPTTATQWDAYAATFGQSSGGSTPGDNTDDPQAKFRRLMGMKGDNKPLNQDTMQKSSDIINQQNKLLADLDQQYEESRFLTHRARGVGFGFGGSIVSNLTKTEGVVSEKGPEDK